ncbi:MAG: hypothetical protein RJQ09_10340 [Cyclobacteriaceae bacterium]
MRKILIICLLAILAAGSYAFYEFWYKNESRSLWSVIPENASLVYEATNFDELLTRHSDLPTWQNLNRISAVNDATTNLEYLDSLIGGNKGLNKILSDNDVLISLHVTSKTTFDFLFALEVKDIEGHALISQGLKNLEAQNLRINKRQYLGHTLSEIENGENTFTFIFYKSYFIGSFTSFLVEDVIRTIEEDSVRPFNQEHASLFSLAKLVNDAGNIYVNGSQIGALLGVFVNDGVINTDFFNTLGASGFLDFSLSDQHILMNGFTLGSKPPSFLSTFTSNAATPFNLSQLVPLRTAVLHHFTVSDPVEWQQRLRTYYGANSGIPNRHDTLKSALDFDIMQLVKGVDSEMAVATMETSDLSNPSKLILIELREPNEFKKELRRLTQSIASSGSDSIYAEQYDETTISQLPVSEFPELLLGSFADQFPSTFYLFYNNYLVLGNSINVLRDWYDDVQQENTWGKSVRVRKFLESTLQEANFSIYVNLVRSWELIQSGLNDEWKQFASENAFAVRQFEMGAFQFSSIDDKFYTSLALYQPESSQNASTGYEMVNSLDFASRITSKPFVVRNHNDRGFENIVQDSLNNIYLISSDGRVIWNDSLSEQIVTNIHQIDFYKNGKLQYLFGTTNTLHLLDRNGDVVPPYPLKLSANIEIDYLSVIDYDKSRNYRFMVVDKSGDLYLYDKNGNSLDGWNPRNIDRPLAFPGFHLRIRGTDRIMAVQQNGIVNSFARRGTPTKGFPIDLKGNTSGPGFIRIGSSFESSSMTTITLEGEIVQFNLNGEILKREQLYKPSKETQFHTLPDASGQSYLFIRQDDNHLAVLDLNGQILFEKDYIASDKLSWQYYNFGGGKEIVIILDGEQEFGYIYNKQGQLINFQPIEASNPVSVLYFTKTDKFRLFKTYQNEFSVIEFDYQ